MQESKFKSSYFIKDGKTMLTRSFYAFAIHWQTFYTGRINGDALISMVVQSTVRQKFWALLSWKENAILPMYEPIQHHYIMKL